MPSLKYLFARAAQMDYKNMFQRIDNISKKTGKSKLSILNDIRVCAMKYGAGYSDYDLFEMYNLTPSERDTYITRGRNNDLIKKYNKPEFGYLFRNKVEFNTLFKDFINREFIKVNGTPKEDVLAFMEKHQTFMAKPVMGSCGKGIEKININDYDNLEDIYNYLTSDGMNFLLEEVIIQNEKVSKIYPKAINTVRIVTILTDDFTPHVICAYFRIGNGSFVDNFNSGGMVAPVDEETGVVIDKAIDKQKNLYDHHPLTNSLIKGFEFPDWDKALELVKNTSKLIPNMRYIGWDVAFSNKGITLVEGNEYPGHDIYQLPEHTPNKIGIWPKFTKAINDKTENVNTPPN